VARRLGRHACGPGASGSERARSEPAGSASERSLHGTGARALPCHGRWRGPTRQHLRASRAGRQVRWAAADV